MRPNFISAETGLYYDYVQDWSEGSWDAGFYESDASENYVRLSYVEEVLGKDAVEKLKE